MAADVQTIILAIIIGTLLAIVYSLRILVIIERRIANMEKNILVMAKKIAKEEFKIEKALRRKK